MTKAKTQCAHDAGPPRLINEQPKPLSWEELRERFIRAGWTPAQADEEIQNMQEECESGM